MLSLSGEPREEMDWFYSKELGTVSFIYNVQDITPPNRGKKIVFIFPPWYSPSSDLESKHFKVHAVSGLRSTTVLCQSEYCDQLCQFVHTYNHLPLPHTKACEQT